MKRHRPRALEMYAALAIPTEALLYSLLLGAGVLIVVSVWVFLGWRS